MREVQRNDIKTVTGVKVDADFVREQSPDVVIVATGATPHRPELELMDDPTVLDAWDVINGTEVPDWPNRGCRLAM